MSDKKPPPPDIADLARLGKLGDSPRDGGQVVEMFPKRQPGDDSDLEVDEYEPPAEHDWLRRDVVAALEQGDYADAARKAEELHRRTAVAELIPWIGWSQIMAPLEPMDWVVEGLEIAQGAPAMVAGYGFSGKTLSLQSLLVSVAAGVKIWGELPCEAGPVAHVDGEQGERLSRDRYQRLCRSLRLELEDLERSGDMRLVCYPKPKLSEEVERSWAQLFEGRRLVLIDSLRALLPPGVDENSSQVRHHLDMLARISQAEGCAIVVLHHARKSPQGGGTERLREAVRGSGALFDALACCLVFTGEKGEPAVVHQEKARITGYIREPFALTFSDEAEPGSGCDCGTCAACRWGVRVTMSAVEDLTMRNRKEQHEQLLESILSYMRQHPDCSGRMVRQGVAGGNAAIGAALDELELGGRASNNGSANRPRWRAV